jgi:hypothetical protein
MYKVICKLPNASAIIGGIPFEPHKDGGMISVDVVDDATAKRLSSIQGYSLVQEDQPAKKRGRKSAAEIAQEEKVLEQMLEQVKDQEQPPEVEDALVPESKDSAN